MSRYVWKIIDHLPQNRLPTELQVLQRYEFIRQNSEEEISETVNIIIQEILDIWNKAYIQTMDMKHIKRKLLHSKKSLINRYKNMKRHVERIDFSELNVLLDIKKGTANFRNEEDRMFYLDQKDKRVATIGSVDRIDNKKILCNTARYIREKVKEKTKEAGKTGKRKLQLDVIEPPMNEKRQTYAGKLCVVQDLENDASGEEYENESEDPNWKEDITKRALSYRKKAESDKITISLDKDTWLDNIALISDKTFTSSRVAAQISAAALSTAGESERLEISKLTMSHRTLHRKRDKLRISSDKIITENWRKSTKNHLFLLHWDEKTLRHLRQVDGSNAYMAIVLTDLMSGIEKILAIIEMENSNAEQGVSSVITALEQWKIDKKSIIGCVFDTTNTNSGWKSGILVRLEKFLGQRVIHVYCRHHILERMANDVVRECHGPSTAPEELTYNFFIDSWNKLIISDIEQIQIDRRTQGLLSDTIAFASEMLKLDFRDDYLEVVNLTLTLVGAYPKNLPSYAIRPPGSISHARWMAKILCELKIALFSSQLLKLEVITEEQAKSHKQLALFFILYYVEPWMMATLSRDAPVNDIKLRNSLNEIPSHLLKEYPLFKPMADAMKKRFDEHLWYLSEELVTLSLFSKKIDNAVKNKCRKAMLNHYEETPGIITGKLITPLLSNSRSTLIYNLFGKESWRLLRLCGVEGKSFLEHPASSWDEHSDYKMLENIVKNFVVVNDAAERAVLLAKTLQNKLTKNSNMKEKLVNVIPELRKICKSGRKGDLFIDINAYLRNQYV